MMVDEVQAIAQPSNGQLCRAGKGLERMRVEADTERMRAVLAMMQQHPDLASQLVQLLLTK